MLRQIAVGALFAMFGAAGILSAQQPAGAPPVPPVKRNILERTDVPGTNLELIYANLEIAPGFRAGRHSHPGVVMAQVVEGEFIEQLLKPEYAQLLVAPGAGAYRGRLRLQPGQSLPPFLLEAAKFGATVEFSARLE